MVLLVSYPPLSSRGCKAIVTYFTLSQAQTIQAQVSLHNIAIKNAAIITRELQIFEGYSIFVCPSIMPAAVALPLN